MLASIATGNSTLFNFSSSLDCHSTLNCLESLGVPVERQDSPGRVLIQGVGLDGLKPSERILDAGNSGSTIRMLSGILAGQPFESTITGDDSLRRRPMDRIITPLRLMGAEVAAAEDRYAPLAIRGGQLRPIAYALPVASAQVKSCVLLAGLFAHGRTTVEEPAATRNHTELMLAEFGADVSASGKAVSVVGRPTLVGREYRIASDLSSAAFFIAAALALPRSELLIENVLINPTRTGFLEVIKRFGASVEIENVRRQHGEPVADLRINSDSTSLQRASTPITLSGSLIPNVIDEIPVLAVLATQTGGGLIVRDAAELRVKESDRIRFTVKNLLRMGASVAEYDDGMAIAGGQRLRGTDIDSAGDHRLAMAFAVAGLIAEGETVIHGSEAVGVSFPDFFQLLESLIER
jgi:3-phosphoshikimate 1-carboxyvinyltransferase